MKYAVFTVIIFTMIFKGMAQSNTTGSYPKAKVYLQDHRILNVKDLEITQTDASFIESDGDTKQTIAVDKIDLIKIPKGNYLWEGALFGAGTMALASLIIDLDTDYLGRPREKDAGFYLGMTGGGAILGALVGVFVPKWKPLYLGKASAGLRPSIQFGFLTKESFSNIKITLKI
ncbi:hypothetical protein [Seonamhaeicola sp.]|uniref:hypothetical protein n=1 Tax=Seonamhaeicola sp. TaxID=1912245 RepID=UPI00261EC6AF|nr:hypothetical protein [Seonamhaeicola sp.]